MITSCSYGFLTVLLNHSNLWPQTMENMNNLKILNYEHLQNAKVCFCDLSSNAKFYFFEISKQLLFVFVTMVWELLRPSTMYKISEWLFCKYSQPGRFTYKYIGSLAQFLDLGFDVQTKNCNSINYMCR